MESLFAHNANLVYAMAYWAPESPARLKAFSVAAVKSKEREILGLLGLPAEQSLVKVLRKMGPPVQNAGAFRAVVWLYTNDPWAREMLRQVERIDLDVLWLLASYRRELVGPKMVIAAGDPGKVVIVIQALSDLRREWVSQRHYRPTEKWPYNNLTPSQLQGALAKLILRRKLGRRYPPPPFPLPPGLIHIASPLAAYKEGKAQRNCSFSMDDMLSKGEGCLLHVQTGYSMATALVVFGRPSNIMSASSAWYISDMTSWDNSPPSAQALQLVLDWLRENQPMVPHDLLDQRPRKETWDEKGLDQ